MQIDIRTNQSRIIQPLCRYVFSPAKGGKQSSADLKTEQSK